MLDVVILCVIMLSVIVLSVAYAEYCIFILKGTILIVTILCAYDPYATCH